MSPDSVMHNGLEPPEGMSRRDFVTLLGASMALAGLGGCVREPDDRILPYVSTPPDVVPGEPLHYATSMVLDGYATGLLVTSREGRPIKIEGNPSHPASLGASGVLEQASLLQLYDPHRATAPRAGRRRTTLAAARAALSPDALRQRVGARGAGLQLLLEPTSSPLIVELLNRVRARYPDARVSFFAPLASASPIVASRNAFGAPLVPQYEFRHADIVVSLGANVLAEGPFHLRHAFDFAQHRRATNDARLYVTETAPTPTGTLADRRIALAPGDIGRVAAALLAAASGTPHPRAAKASSELAPAVREWVMVVARELVTLPGKSLVVVGERQPAAVHVIGHALNDALHNVGRTVSYSPSVVLEAAEPSHDVATFASGIDNGTDTLIILDVNACYTAPADVELTRRMRTVRQSIYLGGYDDETARVATWHIPASHYLETWGDALAYDGTLSLIQPLIAPLHESLSAAEVLAALAGDATTSVHDLLRERWSISSASTGVTWEETLRLGHVTESALPRSTPSVQPAAVSDSVRIVTTTDHVQGTLEVAFVPGAVHDGRFADNAWLQELPDPTTKLTWDNAALLSPASAASAHLETGDIVRLQRDDRTVELPALVVPGHADGTVTLAIGYGRSGAEAVARDVGVDVNALRSAAAPFSASGVRLVSTGERRQLAITQEHWTLDGRAESIIGEATLGSPSEVRRRHRRPLTLYEPPAPASTGFATDQWAMTIDLDRCTGCSACVVACQAENNIPVVGRDGVLDSREMHWLRIDRYVQGDTESPRFVTQPMLCQQCEKAPCEYVCPVNATVHSDDGLNEMVYNRCVGTRFCSNNCPYKVRRFNWFDYNHELAETERMAKNPEVTVRARGVMEKCTFCVQRIRRAQNDAELASAPQTGPVMTACQQACPTRAIVFGSLTSPDSDVSRLANDPRAFSALDELGTLPRVSYLRREVRSTSASNHSVDER